MNSWAFFWIFMIVLLFVDTNLFLKGYDTFLWTHKTEAEKLIQQIRIEKLRGDRE